ncbi:hypothetical protein KIW84_012450 [Lathyrus oleraceus]|uniref:Uncharacterized protein n=1 Tax=Pisum sativum TaxID=3888 RepID=A0A9D5GWM1_PEA|nr:hypothetical protein KIW84_012450 [Pisum sativum]
MCLGIRINVLDDCWVVKGLKLRNVLSTPGSKFVEKICAITPPQRDSPYQDSCLWSGTLTGQFTIDSSYELQNSTYQDAKEKQWRKIWKLEVSERIRHLIWLNLGSPCMDWSAILATACYKIWQWRNQKLHNSGYVFPVMLASDIHLSHGQYKCVMALHKKVVSNSKPRVVARWAPAKEIWLIVNTDSAASSNCIAGCGGLIRNDKGDGLGGFAKYIGNCNALIVEFCGVHEGIRLVKNYSIKNVEFQLYQWEQNSASCFKITHHANAGGKVPVLEVDLKDRWIIENGTNHPKLNTASSSLKLIGHAGADGKISVLEVDLND